MIVSVVLQAAETHSISLPHTFIWRPQSVTADLPAIIIKNEMIRDHVCSFIFRLTWTDYPTVQCSYLCSDQPMLTSPFNPFNEIKRVFWCGAPQNRVLFGISYFGWPVGLYPCIFAFCLGCYPFVSILFSLEYLTTDGLLGRGVVEGHFLTGSRWAPSTLSNQDPHM